MKKIVSLLLLAALFVSLFSACGEKTPAAPAEPEPAAPVTAEPAEPVTAEPEPAAPAEPEPVTPAEPPIEQIDYGAKWSAEAGIAQTDSLVSGTAGLKTQLDLTSLFSFTDKGYIIAGKGEMKSSTVFKYSDFTDISLHAGKTLLFTVPVYTTKAGGVHEGGCAFYNAEKKYLSGAKMENGENGVTVKAIAIPADAYYMRFTYYSDSYSTYEGAPTQFSCALEKEAEGERMTVQTVQIPEYRDVVFFGNSEVCEYFAINAEGQSEQASGYGATGFLDCKGALALTVTLPCGNPKYGLSFYDENKKFLSTVQSDKPEQGVELATVAVPENAAYFKTSYFDYENTKKYGDFRCAVYFGEKQTEYRPYQKGEIYFSAEVDQSLDHSGKMNVTTGVLKLPESYTPTGEKTKLILYTHGYSHYVYYGKWGNTANFLTQKNNFNSLGYAVMGCNGARNNDMVYHFTSAGSAQFNEALYNCYRYVIENYNIDPEIYVVAASAGGPWGISFTYEHMDIVKGLQLLSPWTDLKAHEWGQSVRNSFVEYHGFANTSTYEEDKVGLCSPWAHVKVDADGKNYIDDLKVPVQFFCGSAELLPTSTSKFAPNFQPYADALKNGGTNITFTVQEGLNHTQVCSGGVLKVDKAICAFFDSLR